MDIKEYIASGILENYVFGGVTAQEKQEVECLSKIYPEIKEELTALQSTIEKVAEKYATPPPTDLKSKVLAQIKNEEQIVLNAAAETKIIPLESVTKSSSRSQWYAAASIILLVGLGAYTYFVRSELNTSQNEMALVNDSLSTINNQVDELIAANESVKQEVLFYSDQLNFLRDQNTQRIPLLGTPDYANNLATVFWNSQSEKVYLDVNNLPETSSEESYQLWVLIDGVPQDMGVFEFSSLDATASLLKMNPTKNADAFAITREPKGGSVSPTLENLHVIGTI